MIMPMAVSLPATAVVTTGTVDVTVGEDTGFATRYGFFDGSYGSVSNNSLITVDGETGIIREMYSDDVENSNNAKIEFSSPDKAEAALQYVNDTFQELEDSAVNFIIRVNNVRSEFTRDGNFLVGLYTDISNRFDAADVGSTFTLGWDLS